MLTRIMTVREDGWSVEVPVILHPDGILEFASGNMRPYDCGRDVLRNAKPWQVQEFWSMKQAI